MQHTSDRKVCRAKPHTILLLCGNVSVWGCTAILCESCVAALEYEITLTFSGIRNLVDFWDHHSKPWSLPNSDTHFLQKTETQRHGNIF